MIDKIKTVSIPKAKRKEYNLKTKEDLENKLNFDRYTAFTFTFNYIDC